MREVSYNAHIKHEDGKLYNHTIFYDDAALDRNKAIRESGMLAKAKLGIHHDEDLRVAFNFPTVYQYNLWLRDNPIDTDLFFNGKTEDERIGAGRRLALKNPEYVTQIRL
ncbi:MAG: hypothetical protein DRQ46_10665 [Gammaproteobacteria bacterium]|nr:MAG: hypothetical protein DRQ46_10665 [Gammaproteobacteria bacterium]